jgi:hypothetical protein
VSAMLFALGGAAAGAVQAGLLAREARGRPSAMLLFARLALVGLLLFLAARAGSLGFGVGGWMAGFAAAGAAVRRRLR